MEGENTLLEAKLKNKKSISCNRNYQYITFNLDQKNLPKRKSRQENSKYLLNSLIYIIINRLSVSSSLNEEIFIEDQKMD